MVNNSKPTMSSNRPYLIRALYQWIVDNGLTPHLLVDAMVTGVDVPQQYVSNGKIILNIHPHSVRELLLENDWISFSARFSGTSRQVLFPVQATLAIYAKENGQGMTFHDGDYPPDSSGADLGNRRPSLRVVK
ncbi:MAG: ClpXP protease specificity-enhancing factor [Candidatus Nitrosoglobus sp.]|jgi:stringent starvation protein B